MNKENEDEVAGYILEQLNERQKEAATAPFKGRLQIVAGPGTGKTKVLVSRIAYFLIKGKVDPSKVIVTTFTKKAAKEMQERLHEMLKGTGIPVDQLLIGTFHSLCYRIIRRYGWLIGLQGFRVADEREAGEILQEVFKKMGNSDLKYVAGIDNKYTAKFRSDIAKNGKGGWNYASIRKQLSKMKSGAITATGFAKQHINPFLSFVYERQQQALRRNMVLDFDDCLLYCYEILSSHPVMRSAEHVFVDEFQDTNQIQLDLVFKLAESCQNVTVVGDTDQSIYGFRSAQSYNFDIMKKRYQETLGADAVCTVTLVDNYRSTSDILLFSETAMRQQSGRCMKNLRSQYEVSFSPVYSNLISSEQEAKWICFHILLLLKLPDTPFRYNDIAVLVRSASQTRAIENSFVQNNIPYLMLKGRAFWNRKEVIAILDYMRIILNDSDRLAFLHTVNFPRRGLGEKALAYLEEKIDSKMQRDGLCNISISSISKEAVYPSTSRIKLSLRSQTMLLEYWDFIFQTRKKLRDLKCFSSKNYCAEFSTEKQESFSEFFDYVYVNSGLQKEFQKDPSCEMNINEVKKQFKDFVPVDTSIKEREEDDSVESNLYESDNVVEQFLQSVTLNEAPAEAESNDTESEELLMSKKQNGRVTITTIHGSKGLEWPIVFVPGLSEGILPSSIALEFSNKEAVDEERRCFYVATTRAQLLLLLSSYTDLHTAKGWSGKTIELVSRFISIPECIHFLAAENNLFKSEENLAKLFSLRKGLPLNVDLTRVTKNYDSNLRSFLNNISGFDEKEYTSNSSNFLGFHTAKNFLSSRNNVSKTLVKGEREKNNELTALPEASTEKQGKPVLQRKGKKLQLSLKFAPTSTETHASSSFSSDTTKRNFAPTYIPVRKVPSHILKRRKLNNTINHT